MEDVPLLRSATAKRNPGVFEDGPSARWTRAPWVALLPRHQHDVVAYATRPTPPNNSIELCDERPIEDEWGVAVVPEERNGWILTGVQILNSMLGSGILAFPFMLARVGVVAFAGYLILFSTAVFATSVMLMEAGQRLQIFNLTRLTSTVFGARTAHVLNACNYMSGLGALCSYFNVIGSVGSSFIKHALGASFFLSSYSTLILLSALCVAPLVLMRSYGDLTWFSGASLAFIIAIVLFVAVEGHVEAVEAFQLPPMVASSAWTGLEGIGYFAYASSIQTVVFEAYLSTKRDDKHLFVRSSAQQACNKLVASCCIAACPFRYGARFYLPSSQGSHCSR